MALLHASFTPYVRLFWPAQRSPQLLSRAARCLSARLREVCYSEARRQRCKPGTGNLIAAGEARKIEIDANPVRVSWHKGLPRPVFICPAGQRDCYRTPVSERYPRQ